MCQKHVSYVKAKNHKKYKSMKCTVKFISVTNFQSEKNKKKILAKKFLRYLQSVFPKMRFSIVNTTHCISVKNLEKQTYTSQLFTKHKLPIYQNDCLDKRINLRCDSFQNLTFSKKLCKITYLVCNFSKKLILGKTDKRQRKN